MLTGQPPFPPGQAPHVLMQQHLDVTPGTPQSRRYDIPADLDTLVMELLAKNPANRPASANHVITRLRAVQSRLSVLAPPSRPVRTPTSNTVRHMDLLAGIADAAQSLTNEYDKNSLLSGVAEMTADTFPDRAERIAQAITDERRKDWCLQKIAVTAAAADPDLAERIARSIDGTDQAYTLKNVAKEITAADPDLAERIARSITVDVHQAEALGSVAKSIIKADPGRAIEIARSITDEDCQQRILAEIATALVITDLERGERLARSLSGAVRKAQALALAASAVAGTNPDRAAWLADDAEATAADDTNAKVYVARALSTYDLSRAERIARSITGNDSRIWALGDVAEAAVATGSLDRAENIGRAIPGGEYRAQVLAGIAVKMAPADPDRAERMARSIPGLSPAGKTRHQRSRVSQRPRQPPTQK